MDKQKNIADKQFLAKILFTREQLDQKVVAKKVGISEKTMSKWVNYFNWKSLRRRLLLSKEEQLNALYEQLENLNNAIKKTDAGYANTKEADILIKLTAAINNLETDLAIADLVESGKRYIKFIQRTESIEEVMKQTDMWHSFIQTQIKK